MSDKNKGGIFETVKTIVYAVLIAVVVRTVAYEPFNIPSASMVPTLLIGDYLFVSKFSYGYSRYSLPLGLPIIQGRLFEKAPERGDVVVFKKPADNATDYIKRVIGLPGERIQMREGRLYINDVEVPRRAIENYIDSEGIVSRPVPQYIETLPNGVEHHILELLGDEGPLDNTPVFVVPSDHYFMMGDNRDNSSDSRDPSGGVGFVPKENLVGRADVLFFSTDGSAPFWAVWKWPLAIRFERLFEPVQ